MHVSGFYFWRECICFDRRSFCNLAGRQWSATSSKALCGQGFTIDELYANVTPRPTVGPMTRWFCGQSRRCRRADPLSASSREAIVRRAMLTLRDAYTWVGVLERFEDSLRLLVRLLPEYFGDMAIERASREHVRPRVAGRSSQHSGSTYPQPSPATLRKLTLENEDDLRVYQYAVTVLQQRLECCSGGQQGSRLALPAMPMRPGPGVEQRGDDGMTSSRGVVAGNRAAEALLRADARGSTRSNDSAAHTRLSHTRTHQYLTPSAPVQ